MVRNDQNRSTLPYTKVGDYYIPNLILDDQPDKEISVYARMRERYLQKHHPGRYSYLLLSGELDPHLLEIDTAAQHYLDAMIPHMAHTAGITEALKAQDQLVWLGRMNAVRAQVEDMIRAELIYY